MVVSLQNIVLWIEMHLPTPISSVDLDLFGVLVNHFHFLFLCIVHSHMQTGGLTNGYYSANH